MQVTWELFFCSAQEKINKEYFRLRSQSHNLVLDVDGCGRRPGTRLILWEAKSLSDYFHNQVFYEDKSQGTICSLSNNMCMDADGKCYFSSYISDRKKVLSMIWRK